MRETRFSFCSSRMSLCLIAFVIVAFAPDNIHAQDQAKNDRPSVGLVLSGGGARGAAHVGVIKVLDELRIPIDYIAGTSMGAIVGGLYASGMSADELETVIASADWTALLRDRPPRARRSFRRKSDDIGFLIDFELGIDKSGLILPSGLVQGQNLEIALKRFVLPAISINDFDALPIPFRAVATDMVAGEAVILDSGDLATAMRASMSAPGIFKPVRQDGRILVDGGIENNLPVQIVRDMGADILIVVDVGFPLLPEEQLNSALAVTNQMLTILINSRARDQAALLTPNDILITPNLGDFGSQDFHRMLKAQTLGSKKALELQGRLASLSVSKEKYVDYRNRLEMNRRGLPVIDKVVVENESKLSPKVIEARLSAQEGELFDPDQLERDISNIYGFDTFETVSYDLLDRRGATTLAVRATKKSWGPNYMRFGINLEDDFDGASSYNIAARFTRTEINRKGGEFRAEVQIGASPRLFAEFYQPLDFASRWFVNPRIEYSRESSGLFDAGRQIAQFRSNQTELSLDGGRQFGNWGELRVGLTRSRSNAALQIGAPSFDDSRSVDLAGISSIFATDTIDRFAIPKSGTNFSLGWTGFRESLGSDATFDIAGLFFLNAQTWGNHTILNWWNLASTVNDKSGGIVPFALGGLFNLSGYGAERISGKHMGIGRLLYYYRLGEKTLPVLDTPIYVGTSIEVGKVWQNSDAVGLDKTQVAGSVFIVVDTLLGPLYVAYGAGEGGQRSAHLFLGQTF